MATQNLIQIKRSENTAAPGSLANGELAFSGNGDILYIGNFGSVTAVGGARNPGTLTANQALVANSTSGIDKVIVANLQPVGVYANGSLGSAGQVLHSNSTGVYWADTSTTLSSLTDTNITSPADGAMLFYDTGTSKWIDNVISGDATVADTGVLTLATVNDDAGILGDANSVPQITIDAKGRITNATSVDINHDTLLNFVSNEHIDHSSVTLSAGAGLTGGGDITTNRTFTVGAGSGVTVNADDVAVNAQDGLVANSSGLFVEAGNSQVVSNSSGIFITEGQINHDNLSGFVSNEHIDHSTVTLTAGNGLTGGGTIAASRTFAVGAANGISVSADAVEVTAANGISVTAAGVNVLAGTGVTSNSTGVHIGQSVGTSDDVTFNDVTVAGNLVVSGTLTEVNTNQLVVEDNLIKVAANNTTDVVDFGFYGQYDDSGTKYAGLYRDASDGTGVFKLFDALATEPTGTTISGGSLAALDVGDLSASSLALTTDLAVQHGGTGAGTFTTNGIIYGNGTSPLQVTAAGTQYQVLQAGAGGVPEFGSLDGGTF